MLIEPYKLTKAEFQKAIDEHRPQGPCSSQRYNGKTDYQLIRHLERVKQMSFGVHEWLFNKALNGCEESLFKIEYSYDLYSEVIAKAKEENLI